MNWKVTYRTKDGRVTTETMGAEDRTGLFQKLAGRGIRPTGVTAEAPHRKGITRPSGILSLKFMGTFSLLLILALVLYLFLYPSGTEQPIPHPKERTTNVAKPRPPSPPREAVRKEYPSVQAAPVTAVQSSANTSTVESDNGIPPSQRVIEILSIATNHDGSVLERFRTADGKIRSRQSAPPDVFDNASDQALALAALGAASGGSMPPLPPLGDADAEFLKSLEREIVIRDSDSEEVQALKQSVIAYRAEMRKLVEEGNSVADILREHRELVNRDAALRTEAERLVKEFLDNGDEDGAHRCLESVNAELVALGAREIEMPPSREERRAAIRAHARKALNP